MHKKASYAISYACQKGVRSVVSPGKRTYVFPDGAVGGLFLCSVVVGNVSPIPGTPDMKDPSVHKAGCITAEGSEDMLVAFKDFQAIPKYLLTIGKFFHKKYVCVWCFRL